MNNKHSLSYVSKDAVGTDLKYLFVTDFDDAALSKFYEKFIELDTDKNIKIIPIVISSYGGEVYSLLGMLDIMKTASKPIATIALGKAMSCGAVLLSAGSKGYRYAGETSTILIHEVSAGARGKNTEIQNDASEIKKLNVKLMNILALNCEQKKNFFIDMLKTKSNVNLHFSAVEAKALGVIDFTSIPKLLKIND